MAKVDPEALEREADEMIARMQREQGLTPDEDRDTETGGDESGDEPTSGQEDTGEESEGEADPEPQSSEGGEDEGEDPGNEGDDDAESYWEKRYKNAQARMTKATQEAAELRRKVESLEREVETAKKEAAEKPSAEPEDKDLSQLMEDYPDVVGPLVRSIQELKSQLSETRETISSRDEESSLQKHFDAIASEHADWREVTQSDDFVGWLERQTPTWQRIAREGTSAEVVDLLSRYKKDMGLDSPLDEGEPEPRRREERRQRRVEQARKVAEPRMPRARKPDANAGKKVWSMSEISRMPLDQFREHEAEIDQALAEGRVRP